MFCFVFVFVFAFCFLFNNPISSSICKLALRSEIYNCTFKNTNKVSIIIISFVPKYNSYNNYSNYHIASMHTRTTHRSTHAIIQLLHMISLFKARPLFYKFFFFFFKKKKKLDKLRTKSTSIITVLKEENKQDYKVHLSTSFCKLLFLVQIYFSISYLLFTLTIKLSMVGSTAFLIPSATP